MASKEHKIVRRAQALAELGRLSCLLAERFNVLRPNVRVVNRDGELAEIQRVERINGLLNQVLRVNEVERTRKPVKHGANK
jgi:hypothetical protein